MSQCVRKQETWSKNETDLESGGDLPVDRSFGEAARVLGDPVVEIPHAPPGACRAGGLVSRFFSFFGGGGGDWVC